MNPKIDISNTRIRTPRLLLRPWTWDDVQDLYAYASVDGVGQMAGWMPHQNVEESRAILQMFMDEKKTFALEYQGKVIGSLGVEAYDEPTYPELDAVAAREIGYVLSRDYWGRGLVPEAVQAVIEYLFDTVGLDVIVVGHFARNDRSRRVIEKCGFTYVKTTTYQTRYDTVEPSLGYLLWNPAGNSPQ